ncbi:hypothetical protein [Jatrophihabitans sp.]|uniref:hypothetical protein n=1 Tax=Jatrophihabitans sp. TaxID=1932789 RepID=UPI0030C77140|nr:hypothetical protein [Jatrophihabitans sp.]
MATESVVPTETLLDVAAVRALLVRAVEEKGADYVYVNPDGAIAAGGNVSCFNYDPETFEPSCIVGHVLHYMGVDLRTVGRHDTAQHSCYGRVEGSARAALYAAQFVQDDGGTWGEALVAFDAAVSA